MLPKLRPFSRIKPRYKRWASAQELAHASRVRKLGCLVSGLPATIHHVTGYADRAGRFTRSHRLVVPLAAKFHLIQYGPKESVEALGHQGFYRKYRIDLLAEAKRLEAESVEMGILA